MINTIIVIVPKMYELFIHLQNAYYIHKEYSKHFVNFDKIKAAKPCKYSRQQSTMHVYVFMFTLLYKQENRGSLLATHTYSATFIRLRLPGVSIPQTKNSLSTNACHAGA